MGTVQMLVEEYLLTHLLTESLEYHIGNLKTNLTNSRSPADVVDDKKVVQFPRSRFSVSSAHDLNNYLTMHTYCYLA